MEYINATQISPLISHVQIKVCYVGQQPNRNGTVITKEVATKLGQNLPGTPIVGYYNNKTQDFDSHNRETVIENNEIRMIDMTKPYGFVDVGAKVWFEKFLDDGVEHEYLCTEGYLWTGVYEESQRIIDKGNNQSMELNEKYQKGFWTEDSNSGKNIFIISDGLIEKLCILGSDVEPCFEGSQIRGFSLTNSEFTEFKATMFSMINELKDALNKGGSEETMDNENKALHLEEEIPVVPTEFEKKEQEEEEKTGAEAEKSTDSSKEEEDKEKNRKYNLSEIPEYVSLQNEYSKLQDSYSTLEKTNNDLSAELETLRTFKLEIEREKKQAMIDSFYMLSDEDKQDVIDNVDTYSLDDIEAKLSIICVRNKVNFSIAENEQQDDLSTQQYMLNLNTNNEIDDDDAPDWVKKVRQNSN